MTNRNYNKLKIITSHYELMDAEGNIKLIFGIGWTRPDKTRIGYTINIPNKIMEEIQGDADDKS